MPHSSNQGTLLQKSGTVIIDAGTHRAESSRVAEAATVIKNTRRDVNIALINELAMRRNRLGKLQLRALGKPNHVLYELKNMRPTTASNLRL